MKEDTINLLVETFNVRVLNIQLKLLHQHGFKAIPIGQATISTDTGTTITAWVEGPIVNVGKAEDIISGKLS